MDFLQAANANQTVLLLAALWVLPWKGVALWRASKNAHKVWFIVLLIVNTLAILDIIYILFFSKPKEKEEQQEILPPKT